MCPLLRFNDGFDHTSPELRDEVKERQMELNKERFALGVDGLFGRDTENAVKRFQAEHFLNDDGVVGPVTWAALLGTTTPDLATTFPTTFARNNTSLLTQFREASQHRALVEEAAQKFGLQPSVIGGIGSRESHWGLILRPAGPEGTGNFTERRFPARFRAQDKPQRSRAFARRSRSL
jgi:hypothetical protein